MHFLHLIYFNNVKKIYNKPTPRLCFVNPAIRPSREGTTPHSKTKSLFNFYILNSLLICSTFTAPDLLRFARNDARLLLPPHFHITIIASH
jgi:hypothetical protein